jgi:hypothetical protein
MRNGIEGSNAVKLFPRVKQLARVAPVEGGTTGEMFPSHSKGAAEAERDRKKGTSGPGMRMSAKEN